jgi:hypothetical protein
LIGADRKWPTDPQTDAIDPELTSTAKEVDQINALHINSGQFITGRSLRIPDNLCFATAFGRSLLCNLFRQFTADQAALRTSAL